MQQNGIVNPTPVQEQALPLTLEGQDIIAQSETGSGKTLAFILPIIERIEPNSSTIQALIVTPTRELALQITEEVEKLISKIDGIEVLAVYGGQDVDKQLKRLKKNVQIVVGTPGRLLDHIKRETVQLSNISFLVLDEADQMLHIGFLNEVEEIIKETPVERQTLLFSATVPAEIRKLSKKYMKDPKYIQVEKRQGPAKNIKQEAIHTTDRAKQAILIELLETHRPFLAVIFCRTKRRVGKLYESLKSKGLNCDELHGDLSQTKREQAMKRFRDAETQFLIATDVAARGLDVDGVTHVFNYDIPQDSESYVHRIGRTGRAGMDGMAITLYTSADKGTLALIEKELNCTINKRDTGNIVREDKTHQKLNHDSKGQEKREFKHNKNGTSKRSSQSRRGNSKATTEPKPFKNKTSKGNRPAKKQRRV